MTYEQIEKAAQDHADRYFIQDAEIFCNEPWNNAKDLYAKTLADFAKCCMSKQWISVDERLPESMQRVLVWIGDEAFACWYTKSGRFKTTLRSKERYSEDKSLYERIHLSPCREDVTEVATHWLPIPQLNPEKEER